MPSVSGVLVFLHMGWWSKGLDDVLVLERIAAYLDSLQEKANELKKMQDETEKEIGELVLSIRGKAFREGL